MDKRLERIPGTPPGGNNIVHKGPDTFQDVLSPVVPFYAYFITEVAIPYIFLEFYVSMGKLPYRICTDNAIIVFV